MNTGFRTLPTDLDFARRSAKYLAESGCPRSQIEAALVQELAITPPKAADIIAAIAA
jgi:hypothetical protein